VGRADDPNQRMQLRAKAGGARKVQARAEETASSLASQAMVAQDRAAAVKKELSNANEAEALERRKVKQLVQDVLEMALQDAKQREEYWKSRYRWF